MDTDGNQLPYWDKVVVYIVADKELLTAKLVAGELDFVGHSAYLKSMELYKNSLKAQNLKIVMWDSTLPLRRDHLPAAHLQGQRVAGVLPEEERAHRHVPVHESQRDQTTWCTLALESHGNGAMWSNSVYYKKGDEAWYAEYDTKKANALLDQEGYTKKDAESYRLLPSGKRLGWTVEYDPEQGDIAPTPRVVHPVLEGHRHRAQDQTARPARCSTSVFAANDLIMTTWQGDISDIVWPQNPRAEIPGPFQPHLGARLGSLGSGRRGQFPDVEEEPPQWLKDQYDGLDEVPLYTRCQRAPGPSRARSGIASTTNCRALAPWASPSRW